MSEVVILPPREPAVRPTGKASTFAAFSLILTVAGIALRFVNIFMECIVFRYGWESVGNILLALFTREMFQWAILLVLPAAALFMLKKKKTKLSKVGTFVTLGVLGLQALAVFVCFLLAVLHGNGGALGNLIGSVAGSNLLSSLVFCFHRINVGFLDFFGILQVLWYLTQSLIALLFIGKNVVCLLAFTSMKRS